MSLNLATGTDQGASLRRKLEPQIREINDRQPDVLLAQEVDRFTARSSFVDQLRLLTAGTHLPHAVYSGGRYPNWPGIGWYGDAVLSRRPMIGGWADYYTHPGGARTNMPTGEIAVYGRLVRFMSMHGSMDGVASARELGEVTSRLYRSERNALVGGDFNQELAPVMQRLRGMFMSAPLAHMDPMSDNSDPRRPNAKPTDPDLGIDHILYAGPDVRPQRYSQFDNFDNSGRWLSDHPVSMLEFTIEPPVEPAYRQVSDWVAASGGAYSAGWSTQELVLQEPYLLHGVCLFRPGHANLQDVNGRHLPFVDLRTRFTSAHNWAVANGYEHGYPNFHTAPTADGQVYGVVGIKRGTADRIVDVPVAELGLPGGALDYVQFEKWLRGCAAYAKARGFAGALPTGHWAVGADQTMQVGVHLYRDAVVERRDLTGGVDVPSVPTFPTS